MKVKTAISVLELNKEFQHETLYEVGKRLVCGNDELQLVESIEYHEPAGEGDQHYCDVHLDDGKIKRIFRPEAITFNLIENGGRCNYSDQFDL
jgi:hypothetical protein